MQALRTEHSRCGTAYATADFFWRAYQFVELTSLSTRDCPLIEEHPEWYQLDENDAPRVHQIAWLVYFDVAFFDLVYNRPLQDYLLEVAPYWIE